VKGNRQFSNNLSIRKQKKDQRRREMKWNNDLKERKEIKCRKWVGPARGIGIYVWNKISTFAKLYAILVCYRI